MPDDGSLNGNKRHCMSNIKVLYLTIILHLYSIFTKYGVCGTYCTAAVITWLDAKLQFPFQSISFIRNAIMLSSNSVFI